MLPNPASSPNPGGTGSTATVRVGTGYAIAHHGEFLQGVFEGEDGRLHRGLLTLPLSSERCQATLWPDHYSGVQTRPPKRDKASQAVLVTLEHLGSGDHGAQLTLESDIAIGHGYGSSTADVVAAIRATAAALNVELRRSTICKLAVEAETACDAIAYADQAVLFAQREGSILEHFGQEYPPLLIVGFRDIGAQPVDTVQMPRARYAPEEIELFRVLRGLTSRSLQQQDPRLLGQVATVSARINQRHLPKRGWKQALELCEMWKACGLQVAHSGTLLGILLDGTDERAPAQAKALREGAAQAGFSDVRVFGINLERIAL